VYIIFTNRLSCALASVGLNEVIKREETMCGMSREMHDSRYFLFTRSSYCKNALISPFLTLTQPLGATRFCAYFVLVFCIKCTLVEIYGNVIRFRNKNNFFMLSRSPHEGGILIGLKLTSEIKPNGERENIFLLYLSIFQRTLIISYHKTFFRL
jgi:hypothetical protein